MARLRNAAGWLGAPILLSVLWSAGACSDGDSGDGVVVERFETNLLDTWEVVRERSDRPIRLQSLSPAGEHLVEGGYLPALELSPPGEVALEVPELSGEARLDLTAGVHFESYVGPSRTVHFEARLDGRVVFETDVEVSADVPQEERRWIHASVPLQGGETLSLQTTMPADDGPAVRAGFGLLEVFVPTRTQRLPSSPERPNVVVIVVDTLRADALGCYGHTAPTSPNIDELAARGSRFTRAYVPSPWTIPSTAAILTGLEPPEQPLYQDDGFWLDGGVVTLAEAFQQEGLSTAGFTCNRLVSNHSNFAQGFETFRAFPGDRVEQVFPQIEDWVRKNSDWRFFLYLQPFEPHRPLEPDADLAELLGAVEPTEQERQTVNREIRRMYAGKKCDEAAIARFFEQRRRLYDAEVASVDRQIGRLVALFGELGLDDRTVIAVTSDHGEEFFEHRMSGHSKQLFDESVRVPLILAGPGVPAGEVRDAAVENRFLAHTLLQLAAIEPESNLDGKNLLDPLDWHEHEPIFFSTELGWWFDTANATMLQKAPVYGVQVAGERFMWFQGKKRHSFTNFDALFDLSNDPDARNDLAPAHPQRTAQLRLEIERWLEECAARVDGHSGDADQTERLLDNLGYTGE